MPSTITAEKAALRIAVREFSLSAPDQAESDRLLFRRFLSLPQVAESASLLLYYGVGNEPDTVRLLEALTTRGKKLFLPRCLPGRQMEARLYWGPEHLSPGAYGIPEPDEDCPVVKRDSLSLILVPAMCCDVRGRRLGHGAGYYDRYLAGYSGLTVALCRDKLLFPVLPAESHDRPVDILLTETRSLSFHRETESGANAPPSM